MSFRQELIEAFHKEMETITQEIEGHITIQEAEYFYAYRDGLERALEIVVEGID